MDNFLKSFISRTLIFNWYSKKRWVKVQKKSQLSDSEVWKPQLQKQRTDSTDKTIQSSMQSCSVSLLILSVFPLLQNTSEHAMRSEKEKLNKWLREANCVQEETMVLPSPTPLSSPLLSLGFRLSYSGDSSPPSQLGHLCHPQVWVTWSSGC